MIWKVLIFAVVVYFLYRMFMNDQNKKKDNVDAKKEEKIASGELIKDPVCGTYIDADSSISVKDGEKTYRFCSYECRDKFVESIQSEREKTKIES